MVITVNPLNKGSIEDAIKELKRYQKRLKEISKEIVLLITSELFQLAQENAPEDAKSLILYPVMNLDDGKGAIVMDGAVEFIEFGTGTVGEAQHGGINEEWLPRLPPPYNVGYNTGPYIIHKDGNSYWFYNSPTGDEYSQPARKKDGTQIPNKWYTKGRPADPFLWRSVQELLEEYKDIVKAVRRGIG